MTSYLEDIFVRMNSYGNRYGDGTEVNLGFLPPLSQLPHATQVCLGDAGIGRQPSERLTTFWSIHSSEDRRLI
jgi:hypothetical protein